MQLVKKLKRYSLFISAGIYTIRLHCTDMLDMECTREEALKRLTEMENGYE